MLRRASCNLPLIATCSVFHSLDRLVRLLLYQRFQRIRHIPVAEATPSAALNMSRDENLNKTLSRLPKGLPPHSPPGGTVTELPKHTATPMTP